VPLFFVIVASALTFVVTVTHPVSAIQYSNYTSDKYQVQFQYPSTWTLNEKTNRFETGSEIKIDSPNLDFFGIGYADDLIRGFGTTNLQSAVIDFLKGITSDYTKDYRVIESPSFIKIGNESAGTFLYTIQDKYETTPTNIAHQIWIVFVGNHGYTISFLGSPSTFDSPENTEIRDHFLKSIKFLGNTTTTSNSTGRFG